MLLLTRISMACGVACRGEGDRKSNAIVIRATRRHGGTLLVHLDGCESLKKGKKSFCNDDRVQNRRAYVIGEE